jgi:hypothetical protein
MDSSFSGASNIVPRPKRFFIPKNPFTEKHHASEMNDYNELQFNTLKNLNFDKTTILIDELSKNNIVWLQNFVDEYGEKNTYICRQIFKKKNENHTITKETILFTTLTDFLEAKIQKKSNSYKSIYFFDLADVEKNIDTWNVYDYSDSENFKDINNGRIKDIRKCKLEYSKNDAENSNYALLDQLVPQLFSQVKMPDKDYNLMEDIERFDNEYNYYANDLISKCLDKMLKDKNEEQSKGIFSTVRIFFKKDENKSPNPTKLSLGSIFCLKNKRSYTL